MIMRIHVVSLNRPSRSQKLLSMAEQGIKPKQSGYTLIEIMVALVIFALLSAMTSYALFHAFQVRSRVNQQANRLNELQLAISLIQRDTQQIIERSIRGTAMQVSAPFIGQPDYTEFTRDGLVNPGGLEQQSTLKRVAYLCQNKQLIRRTWPMLDTPRRKKYTDKTLLSHLDQCAFAYLTRDHQVLPEWRENALEKNREKTAIPVALQMTLNLSQWGEMSLLFTTGSLYEF